MLFGDMGFLPWFKLPKDYHFGGHTFVVCGYDGEKTVLASDMNPDTIALCKGSINGSPKKRYRKKYFFLGHIEKLLRGTGMDGPDTG